MQSSNAKVLSLIKERIKSLSPVPFKLIQFHPDSIDFIPEITLKEESISQPLKKAESEANEAKNEMGKAEEAVAPSKIKSLDELIEAFEARAKEEPRLKEIGDKLTSELDDYLEGVIDRLRMDLFAFKKQIMRKFLHPPELIESFIESFADGMLNSDESFLKMLIRVTRQAIFEKPLDSSQLELSKLKEELEQFTQNSLKNLQKLKEKFFVSFKTFEGFEKAGKSVQMQEVIPEMLPQNHYILEKGVVSHPKNNKKFFFVNWEGKGYEIHQKKQQLFVASSLDFKLGSKSTHGLVFSPGGNRFLVFQGNNARRLLVFFKDSISSAITPDFEWPSPGEDIKFNVCAAFWNEDDILVGGSMNKLSLFRVGVPGIPLKIFKVFDQASPEITDVIPGLGNELLVTGSMTRFVCFDTEKEQIRWKVSSPSNRANNLLVAIVFLKKLELVLYSSKENMVQTINYKDGTVLATTEFGEFKASMGKPILVGSPGENYFLFLRQTELLLVELDPSEGTRMKIKGKTEIPIENSKRPRASWVSYVNSLICDWETNEVVIGNSFGNFAILKLKEEKQETFNDD